MNKEQKLKEVELLSENLSKAKALVFASYRGLKVAEMTELRRNLRSNKSSMKVVKNRLMKRVLKERGLDALADFFKDPTALASSREDPISPVKILVEFAKTHEKLSVKGGYLDGSVLSAKDVEALAKLPSKEVLIARALSSMQSPATNFVGVLAAIPRKLLYALNAIKETKQ